LENEPVERLVQLQIGENQITRIDQAPTYLQLLDYNIARNWEGIVMLDDLGFLLITDSFPGSLLGFCPFLRYNFLVVDLRSQSFFLLVDFSGKMVC